MGATLGLKISAALSVAETCMSLVLTATTITSIALQNQLKRLIKGYQKQFELMADFEAIFKTLNNNQTVLDQVSMVSIQSLKNWYAISNNLKKLYSTAQTLVNQYAEIQIPKNAWTTLTIVGVTFGIVFSIYQSSSLYFQIKRYPKEKQRLNDYFDSSQTLQRKDPLSVKNMRDKNTFYDIGTETPTDTNQITIIEETANTNRKSSKEIATKKRNVKKMLINFNEKWGGRIKNTFRAVMVAASIFFFVNEIKKINELKKEIRQYKEMLGTGGKFEQSEMDLVILLDAIAQDIFSLGTSSYVTMQDFSNSFATTALLNPTISESLFQLEKTWHPQTLVPHFNMSKLQTLYKFSKKITQMNIDFDKFKNDKKNSADSIGDQVFATLKRMYNQFIIIEPVDRSNTQRISNIFSQIGKKFSANVSIASLVSNRSTQEVTFFSELNVAFSKSFQTRDTKVKELKIDNLDAKMKEGTLSKNEFQRLRQRDRVCANAVINNYLILMENRNNGNLNQIDSGEDVDTKISLFSARQKNDVAVTIMERYETFYFDNYTGKQYNPKTVGKTIFGLTITKMEGTTHKTFVTKPYISNMVYIPDNFTVIEDKSTLVKKYKDLNTLRKPPILKPTMEIVSEERVLFMQIRQLKHLNMQEKFDSYFYRRGMLVIASEVVKQKKDEVIKQVKVVKYFRLINESLTGTIWTFEEFKVDSSEKPKQKGY